ncbi:MAG: hypothetical protein HQ567_28100 [Candidatus Nealsonbacteria bacterium]|nr:hypothetical protein [Candidatus Nealsonbacteria bacterium]
MANEPDETVSQIEVNALAAKAHASTYCLIDRTNGADGTVVAINIGARFFLATAAHVIPASHEFSVVLRDSIDNVYDFAARHVHPTLDVGLLELLPKDVPRFRDTFVPADRIGAEADQDTEYNVTVVGYPEKFIDQIDRRPLTQNETLQVHQCNAFTFLSVALPRSEWPTSGTRTDPVLGVDIFISFHPDDSLQFMNAKTTGTVPVTIGSPAPHPSGISGGGIWLFRPSAPNAVWQPVALLHAIQFGFSRSGWLRGALIDTWLEVVENNYSDLKNEIQKIRQRSVSEKATQQERGNEADGLRP